MVVERTIQNLRERPAEDRKAVARWVAVGVAALIFALWSFVFLRSLKNLSLSTEQQQAYSAAVGAVDGITVSVNPSQ